MGAAGRSPTRKIMITWWLSGCIKMQMSDFRKLGSVKVTSRLNSGFSWIFSASTGDFNFICGVQVFLHIHPAPFMLTFVKESAFSLINRIEKYYTLWANTKKDPWDLQLQREIHKYIRLMFAVLRLQTLHCRFPANRLFAVFRPHFSTRLTWSSITQCELHSPFSSYCINRKQQHALPWLGCPLHLFFSGTQKPKRCPGLGLFYAFLSSAFFTVIALLVKTIQGVHAVEISAIRCFFQMLFVVPLLIYKKWVT